MNIVKNTLKIEGMHCSACAMNIDFELEDLEGVKTAKTSYAHQVTEVEYDENKVTTDRIIEQINKTGYRADILS